MVTHIDSKSMDQPGKVASPARGQLNFPCPRSWLRIWSQYPGLSVGLNVSTMFMFVFECIWVPACKSVVFK